MIPREDVIRKLGPEEYRWIARCQVLAVLLFVGLFAGVMLFESDARQADAAAAAAVMAQAQDAAHGENAADSRTSAAGAPKRR